MRHGQEGFVRFTLMLVVNIGCGGGSLRGLVVRIAVVLPVLLAQRAGRVVRVVPIPLAVSPTRPPASGYTLGARSRRPS